MKVLTPNPDFSITRQTPPIVSNLFFRETDLDLRDVALDPAVQEEADVPTHASALEAEVRTSTVEVIATEIETDDQEVP